MNIEMLPWLPDAPENFRQQCKQLGSDGDFDKDAVIRLASCRMDSAQLIHLAKNIAKKPEVLASFPHFRLGILSNTTTDLIAPCLVASALRRGVFLEVVAGSYDQTVQQAIDPDSAINREKLDAVLLALDYRALPLEHGVDDAFAHVDVIRSGIRKHSGAPLIIQNLARPPDTFYGHIERCLPDTLHSRIISYNDKLAAAVAEGTDYLLDIAGLSETVGSENWFDPVQWYTAKLPFSQRFVPLYSDHVARIIGALRGKSGKCLVMDLDNTIWGGVIGDDGLDGIVIGQGNPKGEAYLAVQKMAIDLRQRGVILAVCSKNDDDVARTPFRNHPDMLLHEDHIAIFNANWQDKASNLKAIAEALDIGTDALVFIDDNPVERAMVRSTLPEVNIPELPEDPAFFPRLLLSAGCFESVAVSQEDSQRADIYRADAHRAELHDRIGDMESFLLSLQMEITFSPFDSVGRSRIAQLVNRSNQFNLTTRRYTEAEIAAMEDSDDIFTLQVRLVDKFGDNGMICVVICRTAGDTWEIDTWLMSCRVLGRRVEEAVLDELVKAARNSGKVALIGHYINSNRNGLVRDHYKKLGFDFVSGDDDETLWRLSVVDAEAGDLPFSVIHGP